jgi:hypothetical protein
MLTQHRAISRQGLKRHGPPRAAKHRGQGARPEDPFQIAAERARLSFTEDEWNCLPIHDQSEAIYRELRSLDQEMARRGDPVA